jgi:hypothetical protein
MQNDTGPKQPPKKVDESLTTPHPPKNIELSPEAPGVAVVPPSEEKLDQAVDNANEGEKKVQDRDWNNGRPEVTKEEVPPLPSHQNPEKENEDSLRENKGNKPGDDPFEASEEVNTGQMGG